jgi:hypothetical protein
MLRALPPRRPNPRRGPHLEPLEARALLASFRALDFPPKGMSETVPRLSGDGSVIVGSASTGSGAREAVRWSASSGPVGLGHLGAIAGQRSSYATDESHDGSARAFRSGLDPGVWAALGTRAGGEVVEMPE